MNFYFQLNKNWSWAVGYSKDRGYFAEAWRDLPKPMWVDGNWIYRECKIEIAKTIHEAKTKLQQRLEKINDLAGNKIVVGTSEATESII